MIPHLPAEPGRVNIPFMLHRKSLPSFGAFATFQAAARHLSFTQAANELNVTQAAVSQQIRVLEKALGRELFLRRPNGLALSEDGRLLLDAVGAGLETISTAVEALQNTQVAKRKVTIAATTAMAREFLWPLARKYLREHPDVEIVILASDDDKTLPALADVDLALVCGIERFAAGDELHFLFNEIVQPVCSPGFLAENGPFETASDLASARLLHLHDRHWQSEAIGWRSLDWSAWLGVHGVRYDPVVMGLSTNSYPLLLDAAMAGEGIALGWRHLTKLYLEQQTLVHACPLTFVWERGNFLKINAATAGENIHAKKLASSVMDAAREIRSNSP